MELDKDPAISDSKIHIHSIDSETEDIIHVHSHTLAKQSPFFAKLFTTEMRGAKRSTIELHVENTTELHSLLQLVKFIYHGEQALASSCQDEIFNLLLVADKLQVSSCVSSCMEKLLRAPMTSEFAFKCFEMLPETSELQPLRKSSEDFIQKTISLEDCAGLPPALMEVVLKNDAFHSRATSEYDVYEMLLRWGQSSEHHQLAFGDLMNYIRFSNMSVVDIRRLYEDIKLRRVAVSESNRKKIKSLSMSGLYKLAEFGPTQAVEVVLENDIRRHVGTQTLFDFLKPLRVKFWVKLPMQKCYLQRQAREVVKERLKVPVEMQRIWEWPLKSMGPNQVMKENDTSEVDPTPTAGGSLHLYSEVFLPDKKPDIERQVLSFVMRYNCGDSSRGETMSFVGNLWLEYKACINVPEIEDQVRKMPGCSGSGSKIYKLSGGLRVLDNHSTIERGMVLCCATENKFHDLSGYFFTAFLRRPVRYT